MLIVLGVASVLGLLIGLGALRLHLVTDALADVRAYYDAGARLNAGLPLYEQAATTDDAAFYRYPPLLAILFRPLALLPFETAALIWEAILVAVTVMTLARLRPRRVVLLAAGMLAMPLLWTLAIGQAQALVTALLAVGSPWAVAFAGHIKLTPWLVGIYWAGRRDWRSLGLLTWWIVGLALVQLVLEPQNTIAFLTFSSLEQVGDVVNLSPFAVSPLLWVATVAVLGLVAWRLAPTRWGWAAAVVLSVGVTPRLLAYQLSTLLAALGGPRDAERPSTSGR
ncbi:MAG TPA: glycosyltransferase 87 family protein [Candidatus Limnocylindrales bacterium]|nr:glycosyltransferase 87 family protein [Candidatus Limnocylindrales bacterium]